MTENYRLILSFSYYLPPLLSCGKYLLFTSFPQFYPNFKMIKVIIIIIIPPSFCEKLIISYYVFQTRLI